MLPITGVLRHEKTIVYQRSRELMEIAADLVEQLPGGFAFLVDPLRRSTSSVARNFGEGFYQRSRAPQRKYFDVASHSVRT